MQLSEYLNNFAYCQPAQSKFNCLKWKSVKVFLFPTSRQCENNPQHKKAALEIDENLLVPESQRSKLQFLPHICHNS